MRRRSALGLYRSLCSLCETTAAQPSGERHANAPTKAATEPSAPGMLVPVAGGGCRRIACSMAKRVDAAEPTVRADAAGDLVEERFARALQALVAELKHD